MVHEDLLHATSILTWSAFVAPWQESSDENVFSEASERMVMCFVLWIYTDV